MRVLSKNMVNSRLWRKKELLGIARKEYMQSYLGGAQRGLINASEAD